MILDLHRQTFVGGIKRRAFGDRPRLEHALHLQPEIVVQPRRGMALDDKAVPRFLFDLRRRLGRFLKTPLSFVLVKRHGGYCNSGLQFAVWFGRENRRARHLKV